MCSTSSRCTADHVGGGETLEVHPALLPPVVVAVGAVLLEEGLDDGVEGGAIGLPVGGRRARRRRGSQRGHGHEQQDEGATHGVPGIVARARLVTLPNRRSGQVASARSKRRPLPDAAYVAETRMSLRRISKTSVALGGMEPLPVAP